MAAPITHIILALIVLNGPLKDSNFDQKEFIIGTSFPDIRYTLTIERDVTHAKDVTFKQIKEAASSFEAGRLLHCWVDGLRIDFFNKNYTHLRPLLHTASAKFYEDMLLHNEITKVSQDSWSVVSLYFDSILKEQRDFALKYKFTDEDIKKWHKIIALYVQDKPSLETLEAHAVRFVGKEASRELIEGVPLVIRNKDIDLAILDVYKNISVPILMKNKEIERAILDFYNHIAENLISGSH
ncbi:MAG: hypothetical protein ABH827_05960 [bacterium]